jgi:hypothetical protein
MWVIIQLLSFDGIISVLAIQVKSINKRNAERIQETTENFTLGNNTMEF